MQIAEAQIERKKEHEINKKGEIDSGNVLLEQREKLLARTVGGLMTCMNNTAKTTYHCQSAIS